MQQIYYALEKIAAKYVQFTYILSLCIKAPRPRKPIRRRGAAFNWLTFAERDTIIDCIQNLLTEGAYA